MTKFNWVDDKDEDVSCAELLNSGFLIGYDETQSAYYFSYYNEIPDLDYISQENFNTMEQAKKAAEEYYATNFMN